MLKKHLLNGPKQLSAIRSWSWLIVDCCLISLHKLSMYKIARKQLKEGVLCFFVFILSLWLKIYFFLSLVFRIFFSLCLKRCLFKAYCSTNPLPSDGQPSEGISGEDLGLFSNEWIFINELFLLLFCRGCLGYISSFERQWGVCVSKAEHNRWTCVDGTVFVGAAGDGL